MNWTSMPLPGQADKGENSNARHAKNGRARERRRAFTRPPSHYVDQTQGTQPLLEPLLDQPP